MLERAGADTLAIRRRVWVRFQTAQKAHANSKLPRIEEFLNCTVLNSEVCWFLDIFGDFALVVRGSLHIQCKHDYRMSHFLCVFFGNLRISNPNLKFVIRTQFDEFRSNRIDIHWWDQLRQSNSTQNFITLLRHLLCTAIQRFSEIVFWYFANLKGFADIVSKFADFLLQIGVIIFPSY